MKGTVKWFSPKGWGFITRDDDGVDVFAHYTNIDGEGFRNIYEGQLVEFDVIATKRGPQAVNIKPQVLPVQETLSAEVPA